MRITLCTGPILPVPAVAGGAVHRFWSQMAPEFAAVGHDVYLYARAWPGQAASEQWQGVTVQRLGGYAHQPSTLSNLWRSWIDGRRLVKQLPDADILVSNDIMLPRLLANRPQCGKLVVAMGRHPKGQLRFYPRVDGVAAASEAVRASVQQQCPRLQSRIKVLPYAIDTERFVDQGPEPRRPGSILFAGRLHPEKGLDLLIEAIRILLPKRSDVQLTCIGPWQEALGGGGPEYRAALHQRAQGLPVTWLEPEFDPGKLAAVYRSHQVFAYPSLAAQGETFGLAPLEAMACGTIPVLSKLPCFQDYLIAGIHGEQFDATSADAAAAMAAALLTVLACPERYQVSARARASEFSIPRVAERWLSAFAQWMAAP